MAVAALVRDADPDRYVASLFAPAALRDDLLALHAFDLEIASLRAKVREPMAGEVRIQWWRDTLGSAPDARSGHPVADALKETISRHRLPLAAFETLLEARIFDLYDDPLATRTDFEGYCGETAGLILQLACLILDREAASRAADACGHGACLATIDRMLRDGQRFEALLPDEIRRAAGEHSAREALMALGLEHRAAFLDAARVLPATLKPAFLHLASAARLPGSEVGRLRRQWAMFRVATGRWPSR